MKSARYMQWRGKWWRYRPVLSMHYISARCYPKGGGGLQFNWYKDKFVVGISPHQRIIKFL